MTIIVDTHCHLDFDAFDRDRDAVVARARSAGVRGFIQIGIDPDSWRATQTLVLQYSGFWRAVGIHPNSVAAHWTNAIKTQLASEVRRDDVVAVGETGVDLYRSSQSHDQQIAAFEAHIDIAREVGLPIIIHQRDAEQPVLETLRKAGGMRGVMHCFGGDWSFARDCLDLGLSLGVGGIATFKNAHDTREAIRRTPVDRIVLETDAPFLAPQAQRGRRNEPAFLSSIIEAVAACRSTSPETVARETTANAEALFDLQISAMEMPA